MLSPILRSFTLVALVAGTAAAQERPGPTVEIAAGWVGFADDGIVSEGMVVGVSF